MIILFSEKKKQEYVLYLSESGLRDLDQLPESIPLNLCPAVKLICDSALILSCELKLDAQSIQRDLTLQRLILTKQMQHHHEIDLAQCYWDWVETETGVTVYVISREIVDQAITQLPVELKQHVHAIQPDFSPHPQPLSRKGRREQSVINLWPWRDVQNRQRKRQWLIGMGIACVAAIMILLIGCWTLHQFVTEDTHQTQRFDQTYDKRRVLLTKQLSTLKQQAAQTQGQVAWFDWIGQHWPMDVHLTHWRYIHQEMRMGVKYPSQRALQTLLDQFANHAQVGRLTLKPAEHNTSDSNTIVINVSSWVKRL